MTETGPTDGVDEALARIGQRARENVRKKRWLLPVFLPIGGAVGYLVSRLDPTGKHHTHHHHSTAGTIIGFAVVAAVLIVAGLIVWKMRRRAGFSWYWNDPPLTAGLDRSDRRTARRDIRRSTPSADPVLRAVETQTVERIKRAQPQWTLWTFPLVWVIMIVNALLPGRSGSARIYYVLLASLFVVFGVLVLLQRRAVDRFPSNDS